MPLIFPIRKIDFNKKYSHIRNRPHAPDAVPISKTGGIAMKFTLFSPAAALLLTFVVPLSPFQTGSAAASGALDHLPVLAEVVPDAVNISPHVPNMGEHWANPADLPVGPVYCVIDGRVVCVEYMVDLEALNAGTDLVGLATGIESPAISHIDIEYKAEGIPPHPVPLYQIHIYFADMQTLAAF